MDLHSDKEAFKEIIALAAEQFSYEQSHVEKGLLGIEDTAGYFSVRICQ